MSDDQYVSGWIAVRDTFQRAIQDNKAILDTPGQPEYHLKRTRGILDALERSVKVVQADIERQINPSMAMDD